MQPDATTLPGALGWTLWYTSEIAVKWLPGFVVSMSGVQPPGTPVPTAPPVITEPVSVLDVVQFLRTTSVPGVYDKLYNDWTIFVGISLALSLVFAAILI